jgi:excisionase family DNA binding protein
MTQAAETNQPGRLWSVREVSEYLGVPVTTIYQWRVRSEGPPAMRMGKHLRFDPQSVARWAHELEENAADGRRHP